MSVVVATLNGAQTVERCLQSAIDQQGVEPEVVVMDGGSTDGTVEVIRALQADIHYWESAPDNGIYHAWNKALRRTTGEWICFLGADDYFTSPSALRRLLHAARNGDAEFASGKAALLDKDGRVVREIGEPWNWDRLKVAQLIAHPGSLHHRSLFERLGDFDESLNIAADYEFLLRMGPVTAAYVDKVIVHLGTSGVSNTNLLEVLREAREIQARHPEIGVVRAYAHFVVAMSKGLGRRALCPY